MRTHRMLAVTAYCVSDQTTTNNIWFGKTNSMGEQLGNDGWADVNTGISSYSKYDKHTFVNMSSKP